MVEADHGTLTRYRQHQALNERPCRPCKDAYNDSVPEQKRATARRHSAITSRTLRLLQLAHPEEYKRLWKEAAAIWDQEQADLAKDLAWAEVFAAARGEADA
jgi:hypothetical protein